ncbi:MAG: MFS transporter [Candidatus Bathyarchaeota archaeon]|nr:MFS transporter [Candidatus Bathyarchaeota archaeon]
MLDWVHRNGKILLAVRPIQAFAASFVSISFAIYLKTLGLSISQIGLVLTGGLISSTLFNLAAGFLEARLGRRKLLVFFGLLSTFGGLVFTFTTNTRLLIVVAIAASMGYGGGFGAAQMLERVILAQSCEDNKRTELYAIRNTVGSLATATGSLFTGLLVLLEGLGYSEPAAYRAMFGVFTGLNLVLIILYMMLDEEAEIKLEEAKKVVLSSETKRYLMLLSVLFSMDALGGAFITQSLVAYWLFERFGLAMDKIGMVFSASSLLAAVSFMAAARISKRIGLINTMVFSHLPANLMMAVVPYMPSLETSLFFYLGRSLLSQMDVPTRDSYTMAIVKPEERARFQSLINLPRSFTLAIGPSIAGYLMQFIGIGTPFLVAGAIKAIYDVLLWLTFKDIKPPEEAEV